MRRAACVLVASLAELACQPVLMEEESPFAAEEEAFRARYDATPIRLVGTVHSAEGDPIEGARVQVLAVGEQAAETATTDADGRFELAGLLRRNRTIRIDADGHRPQVIAERLLVSLGRDEIELDVVISLAQPNQTRFFFAGDVALGRRFLDPEGEASLDEVPPPSDEALIRTDDPGPGSAAVFADVAPLLATADYPVVNLESPVTDRPGTPHETKAFVFFTLPGSLPALVNAGIRYVSLGNNHMYDYLEAGVADTEMHLDEVGLAHSGAGSDADAAFRPHVERLRGTDYAFLSATSIAGEEHPQSYVATEEKGGAADLRDQDRMRAAIASALDAGQVPIAQLHSGVEYGEKPNTQPGNWFDSAVEAGATLVIGHHPHVAQGVSAAGDSLVYYSLGNFAFDQMRQETMLGLTAMVDMAGPLPVRAFATPVYLEDFRPRLIGGVLLAREVRRLAELSSGARMYAFSGRGWIVLGEQVPIAEERLIEVMATIDESGVAIVDLRGTLEPTESVARAAAPEGLSVIAGRDLMLHGDFEDYDSDADALEASRWDHSADSVSVCMRSPYRGAAALCSWRSSTHRSPSVLPYRNRVRVPGDAAGTPNKSLSLVGYVRGENSGDLAFSVRYQASAGSQEFGEEVALELEAGDRDWTPVWADLNMPADSAGAAPTSGTEHARAMRLFVHHDPPNKGHGVAMYDDLAIVSWDEVSSGSALELAESNPVEFLRLEGPAGNYPIELTLRRMRPPAGG